jgi:hypothetical protein
VGEEYFTTEDSRQSRTDRHTIGFDHVLQVDAAMNEHMRKSDTVVTPELTDRPSPSQPNARAKKDISRGAQTAWIVGTLIVMGLIALYFLTRLDPSDPYAKCQKLIGSDRSCVTQVTVDRLMKPY